MFRMSPGPVIGVDAPEHDPDEPFALLDADYTPETPEVELQDHWRPGLIESLLSSQAEWIDRAALECIEHLFLAGDEPDLSHRTGAELERLHELYGTPHLLDRPDHFFGEPDAPESIRVEWLESLGDGGERLRLSFESTYEIFDPAFESTYRQHSPNEVVHAHLWRHGDRERPTIVGLHCWCGGRLWMEELVFAADDFYEAGYDVALMTLPFHGDRTPAGALFSGQYFPSPDLQRTNEAFGEAIWNLRSLTKWLRSHGQEGPIGLMGGSLGGYTTALAVSLTDMYDFAIPVVAPASFADVIWWHGEGREMHDRAKEAGLTLEGFRRAWSLHTPLHHDLQLATDRVLLIGAAGDAIVRPAQVLSLWRHWNEPEMHWFQGGHLLHFGRRDYLDTILEWLDRTL
jgi:dienelactone hydrolase